MNNKQRNEEQNFGMLNEAEAGMKLGDWNIYGIGSYSPEYAANLSRPGLLLVGQFRGQS